MRKGPQGQQQVLCLGPISRNLSQSSLPGPGGNGHRRPRLLGRRDLSLFDETCNTTRGQGDILDEQTIPNPFFYDVNPSSGNGPWRHTVGLTWHLWSTDEGTWIFIRWTLLRHHETPTIFTTFVKAPRILPIHCTWKCAVPFPQRPKRLFVHPFTISISIASFTVSLFIPSVNTAAYNFRKPPFLFLSTSCQDQLNCAKIFGIYAG